MFSVDGKVIGVCNARDPQDQEGFYAALETISSQLDQANLAFVYKSPRGQDVPAMLAPPTASATARNTVVPVSAAAPLSAATAGAPGLIPQEQAALEEIRRYVKEGAEVVIVVRSRRNPDAKSEIIKIDNASPELVQQLAAEAQAQKGRQETSMEVSHPRQPALEWPNNGPSWRAGQ